MQFVDCKYVSNVPCGAILKDPNTCDSCDLYEFVQKNKSSAEEKINEVK